MQGLSQARDNRVTSWASPDPRGVQPVSPTDTLSPALLGTQRVRECSLLQENDRRPEIISLPVHTTPTTATSVGHLVCWAVRQA